LVSLAARRGSTTPPCDDHGWRWGPSTPQPPDRRADQLRDRLDELLTEATSTLAELRIAARRGRVAELARLARPLAKVAERLDAFAEAHA
jgi:hypothetical protein